MCMCVVILLSASNNETPLKHIRRKLYCEKKSGYMMKEQTKYPLIYSSFDVKRVYKFRHYVCVYLSTELVARKKVIAR
jgi:hypothetical protein